MKLPLITFASDWDAILPAEVGLSHRSTTSSRLPGRRIEGVVSYRIARLVECLNCGGLRRISAGPHAPRYVDGRLVDCRGTGVTP